MHSFVEKDVNAVNNDEAFNNLRNNENNEASESLPDIPVKTPKKKHRATLPQNFKHSDYIEVN